MISLFYYAENSLLYLQTIILLFYHRSLTPSEFQRKFVYANSLISQLYYFCDD